MPRLREDAEPGLRGSVGKASRTRKQQGSARFSPSPPLATHSIALAAPLTAPGAPAPTFLWAGSLGCPGSRWGRRGREGEAERFGLSRLFGHGISCD